MIVGLPGADQVFSEPTLGQERVGGDCFVLILMASKRGMAVVISFVRFASSSPAGGRVPTFFGCNSFCSGGQWRT